MVSDDLYTLDAMPGALRGVLGKAGNAAFFGAAVALRLCASLCGNLVAFKVKGAWCTPLKGIVTWDMVS